MTISEGRSLPERVGTQARWLSEMEAAAYANMSCGSFRTHILPALRPAKFSKRLVRYDRLEIDQAIAARKSGAAPSSDRERALGALYEDNRAGR